jgi:glycine betaine/proline transport system ATP-binding protein
LELQRELGKTVVFVTHDIQEALRLGNRIAILREGRLEQFAAPAELTENPASEYVARFVGHAELTR